MTKEEVIKRIEKYIQDADKCISEDEDYLRGWVSGLSSALETVKKLVS